MEAPAFFRWLSTKYPLVVVNCKETLEANPNGAEFDNIYVDMNGIIDSCTRQEDRLVPKTEEETMDHIFQCIHRLFRIVRPRKVLYIAIDGIVPRAKLNQQRSRRFRASKETSIFMSQLSRRLNYYIQYRKNNDPGWKSIKVILSDASEPGEGKHKIMDYIRKPKAQPNQDPNTQHLLCGADADLVMLGLATHEPNFTIIREELKPSKQRPCDNCGRVGYHIRNCNGIGSYKKMEHETFREESSHVFIRLNVLREYLEKELHIPDLAFEYSFERALDDWVFLCCIVDNNVLPHLPCLEIRENAIDRLVKIYKEIVHTCDGFLTDSGEPNLDRIQLFVNALSKEEDDIFQDRQQKEKRINKKRKHWEIESEDGNSQYLLWKKGYKDRYYNTLFNNPRKEDLDYKIHVLALHYIKGLCWVLRSYYEGVPHWRWFYSYRCAPFASDFNIFMGFSMEFEKGTEPFPPPGYSTAGRKFVPSPDGQD